MEWYIRSADGQRFYLFDKDGERIGEYTPPPVVALLHTAKAAFTQPWVLAGVPYSVYWRKAMTDVAAAEHAAQAALSRRSAR